jgi:chromosome segregation ATPase
MKLLTRRLEATEHTARDARANEVDKWQNEYKRLGESYEELSSGYVSQQGRIDSLNQKSNYLEGLCESLKEAKINEQTKREKLADEMETLRQRYDSHDATIQRLNNSNGELHSKILSLESDNAMQTEHINNLQSSLSKLETENSDLETALGILHDSKDLLRTEVTKLQIDNNQLIGQLGKMKDEKLNIERTAEALQQQKDNLKNKVDNLQVENVELRTQVAQLQEAKANLDEKVDVLARECASFQEQSKARDIKATQESQCRLSNWTIDSGMGESIRASTSSTRKRQISITDEREEKRHRSLLFFGGDDSTFLADPDPEELRLMLTSELPIRRGSEGPPHTEDKWI